MTAPTRASTAKRDDPPPSARPRDPSLDALVEMPNRLGRGLDIALFVHGATVAGELISERQYFDEQEALVQRLLTAEHLDLPEPEGGATHAAPAAGARPTPPGGVGRRKADAPDDVGEPTFVHLRHARLVVPGGSSAELGRSGGVLWRGRVDAVDGYAILDTTPAPPGRGGRA